MRLTGLSVILFTIFQLAGTLPDCHNFSNMQSGLATKSTSSAQESGMLLVGSQRFVYIQVPQVGMNLTFTLNGRDFVLSIHLSGVGRVVAIED